MSAVVFFALLNYVIAAIFVYFSWRNSNTYLSALPNAFVALFYTAMAIWA